MSLPDLTLASTHPLRSMGSLLVMVGQVCHPAPPPLATNHISSSFSVLIGPINHIKHLVSKERLPFSAVYLGSLGLTLYFALGVSSPCPFSMHVLTVCRHIHSSDRCWLVSSRWVHPDLFRPYTLTPLQVVALVSYILAYFPGGTQTLRFGGQIALRGAGSLLPF